ncbi:DUF3243 domain-containing protein [Gottfriedia acidiceleris]|uniref:DUF3243 domain-containing protein n=1 Tax=Gottfriedia acidiceleris TaxID=371036 RepID=UPI000B43DA22|nr:DUF3243 domain-containing protein [Gottfriedia acidiceleris]
MSILDNWDQWKDFLGDRLDATGDKGVGEGAISEMAYRLGNYLANEVEPKNAEEQILKDLWNVADEQEQHTIAHLMMKYVKNK